MIVAASVAGNGGASCEPEVAVQMRIIAAAGVSIEFSDYTRAESAAGGGKCAGNESAGGRVSKLVGGTSRLACGSEDGWDGMIPPWERKKRRGGGADHVLR
jgi:hypothetical protein